MGQHTDGPLFSAKDLQTWRWQMDSAPGVKPPQAAVFCLQPDLLDWARRRFALKPVRGLPGKALLYQRKTGRVMLAGGFSLGAPAMAILAEEHAAFGACRFLSIGVAGALQPELAAGDIVVCQSAIRGEGTSRHYLPPSNSVDADPGMCRALGSILSANGVCFVPGTAWTTDAPYRETRQEVDRYRKQGVLCADMEAAALFAASQALGLRSAALFVIADRLLESGWEPPQNMRLVQNNLKRALEIAIPWLAGGML